jgi:hypothetical protein
MIVRIMIVAEQWSHPRRSIQRNRSPRGRSRTNAAARLAIYAAGGSCIAAR